MRTWMLNDNFIEKNILSFLGMFSNLRKENIDRTFMSSINPAVKFVSTLLVILSVSLSKSIYYVAIVSGFLLVSALSLDKRSLKKVAIIIAIAFLFASFIMIPSLFILKVSNAVVMILKITVSVLCVNILIYSTPTNQMTKSLKALFLPDILILIIETALKHIVIVGDMSVNMMYALKKRTIGARKKKEHALWGILGVLFIKSTIMSDNMHDAMRCRGFNGDYKSLPSLKLGEADLVYILFVLIIIFTGMVL